MGTDKGWEGFVLCRKNARGAGVAGGPVSTVLALRSPTSRSPRGNGGIPRFLIGMQRLSGPNVSTMDTDGPPGGLRRPTSEVQADRELWFPTGTS